MERLSVHQAGEKCISMLQSNLIDSLKLVSMILGDGFGDNERVGFVSKDKTLLKLFSNLVLKLTGKSIKEISGTRSLRINVCSKSLISQLREMVPIFRTKPCNHNPVCPLLQRKESVRIIKHEHLLINSDLFPLTKLPEVINDLDKNDLKEILQIWFSMEGGVTLFPRKFNKGFGVERKVFLTCTHPIIRLQLQKLLEKFDLKFKFDEKSKSLVIRDKKSIERFAKEINFLPGVKISLTTSKFFGFEKSAILSLILWTFERPKGFWKQFQSKDEINQFFIKMLMHS
jgi:hypothetical protein